MKYLKGLTYNFLIVFFANYLLPGIQVMDSVKLPHIGGELLFAIVLGILNTLIYPVLKLFDGRSSSMMRIVLIAIVLNFAAYAALKLIPAGIQIQSIEGYFLPAIAVAAVSILTNYYEMKAHHHSHSQGHSGDEPPSAE